MRPPSTTQHSAFFLVGPTGIGKTAIAQYLAEEGDFDILSADSMLVYRGMDIGTAKPTREERTRARYWGIDLVTPDQPFNVGAWHEHARQAVTETAESGRPLIVVGGTGLYIKSLTHGLDPLPPAQPELRRKAERLYEQEGLTGLQRRLRELGPERYEQLADKDNPRRLIRAIELAEQDAPPAQSWETGATAQQELRPPGEADTAVGSLEGEAPAEPHAHPGVSVPLMGLKMDMEALYIVIRERTERMFNEGLLDEIKTLRNTYSSLSETAREAIGYKEGMDMLDGRMTRTEAVEQTAQRTRRLAKRQMTWFRHQTPVHWMDVKPDRPVREIAAQVREMWNRHGPTTLAH